MSENKLIYSSDGSGRNLALDEKGPKASSRDLVPSEICLKLRIEKKGRGGKAVTVIYEVPNNPAYFKKLLKELKNHCGTGGSQKDSTLEIQGDQRPKIREFLEKKGFKVKG
jgi:translation initiation factor 1